MWPCVLLVLGDRQQRGSSSGKFGGAESAGSVPPISQEPSSWRFTPGRWHSRVKKCWSQDCTIQHRSKVKEWEETRTKWEMLSTEVLGQNGKRFQPKSVCLALALRFTGCGVQGSPRCMSQATSCPVRCRWGITRHLPCSRSLLPLQGAAGQQKTGREGKEQHQGGGTKTAVVNPSQSPCPGTAQERQGCGESRGTEGEIV